MTKPKLLERMANTIMEPVVIRLQTAIATPGSLSDWGDYMRVPRGDADRMIASGTAVLPLAAERTWADYCLTHFDGKVPR